MQFASGIQGNQELLTSRSRARQQQEAVQVQTLRHNQTQTVEARPGLEVRSTSGILWLTQEGEAADILLQAGQSWKASRAGRVVVQAIVTDANWAMRVPPSTGRPRIKYLVLRA
ncbi:hypothetical protein IAD21_01649 [Abditibacteriota bacterium]|nr:hypothetical protein IAD21_01649 [Abditibacteriota bacterium]